jgi:hypothetical protein
MRLQQWAAPRAIAIRIASESAARAYVAAEQVWSELVSRNSRVLQELA